MSPLCLELDELGTVGPKSLFSTLEAGRPYVTPFHTDEWEHWKQPCL